MEAKIVKGSHVGWTSSAAGTLTTKHGEVIEVVPAGKYAANATGARRKIESYVVRAVVVEASRHGKPVVVDKNKAKEKIYWPRECYLLGSRA